MKKNLVVAVTLLALQLAVLFTGIWTSVSLNDNCYFVDDEIGMWQCSSDTNPLILPFLAFATLPPLLAKFILVKIGYKFSWKRIFITHIIVALLLWTALYNVDSLNCGCGGA